MPSPAAAAAAAKEPGGARPLPLYLASQPTRGRVFEREKRPLLARLLFGTGNKRRAMLLAALIKLGLVLAMLYRKHELQLAAWVANAPPSYCAALAASSSSSPSSSSSSSSQQSPLVCTHSGDGDHPSPDSPDALREALAAGTGCVLLHVSATADGELAVVRNTPKALALLTRPPAGSRLAQRAVALPGGARRWWRQATVGDLTLAELRALQWRRPTRRRWRTGTNDSGEGSDDNNSRVLTLQEALRLLLSPSARKQPLLLIIDLERPTGAARASVALADFAKSAVAASKEGGACGGGAGGKEGGGARCMFWAMQDDLVVAAGEAAGRLRRIEGGGKAKRRRGDGGGGAEDAAAADAAYEPTPAAASSSSSSSSLPGLGYFVAERRDPRHPRFQGGGAATAAAVHVDMLLRSGQGGSGGSAVARALHAQGQQAFAYLINRAGPLRAAVVAGAVDAVVTDRATQVSAVLEAWRRQCGARAAMAKG